MKKLALLLVGLGSLATISVSATNYTTTQPEPQYQEQCQPVACDQPVNNQLPLAQEPCNPAPCVPDTVCNPAPCNPAPCNPGC